MYEPETTKYRIHLTIEADGVVERSDVVGAIFGQIEGLLGAELELRELQRQGKIGRIDARVNSKFGKSTGAVTMPTSLDRVETAIIAAAMETVTRIGPCISRIYVQKIEDVRITKRYQIIERAKALLLEYEEPGIEPDTIIETVRESQRLERIETVGEDNAPAGPNVNSSDAIIVVEGRADVINLLKAGIKNTIAVEGTSVSDTIIQFCRKKTATAFLDGDRGGDLILKELLEVTDIDFVAYSPRGESVEDLSRKEILKSLKNKVPISYVLEGRASEFLSSIDEEDEEIKLSQIRETMESSEDVSLDVSDAISIESLKPFKLPNSSEYQKLPEVYEQTENSPNAEEETGDMEEVEEEILVKPDESEEISPKQESGCSIFLHINDIKNHGSIRFVRKNGEFIDKPGIDTMDIEPTDDNHFEGIVVDADINQQLLDRFSLYNVSYLAARNFSTIVRRPANMRLIHF